MAATVCRVKAMTASGHPEASNAIELADLFCRQARRKVKRLFTDLWSNDDSLKYRVASGVLKGRQIWMEEILEGLEVHHPSQTATKPTKRSRPKVVAIN